jgi:hypothetical protein
MTRPLPKTVRELATALDERWDAFAQLLSQIKTSQELTLGKLSGLEANQVQLEARERERNGHIAMLIAWKATHEEWAEAEAGRVAAELAAIEEEKRDGKVRSLVWRQILAGLVTGATIAVGLVAGLVQAGLVG